MDLVVFSDWPRDYKIFNTPHNGFRTPVMWSCVTGCLPRFLTNAVRSVLQNSATTHQKMWYHLSNGPNPQLCRRENLRYHGSFNFRLTVQPPITIHTICCTIHKLFILPIRWTDVSCDCYNNQRLSPQTALNYCYSNGDELFFCEVETECLCVLNLDEFQSSYRRRFNSVARDTTWASPSGL